MLNLYFSAKLFSKSKKNKISRNHYPVSFSRLVTKNDLEDFTRTLKSYKRIPLDLAYLNIDVSTLTIEGEGDALTEHLKSLIHDNLDARTIKINWSRPSTLEEWLIDLESLRHCADVSRPILLQMNHDHVFAGLSSSKLMDVVEQIYKGGEDEHRVLFVSHSPEVISWAINGRAGIRYREVSPRLYRGTPIDSWIDSFVVLRFDTLEMIFRKIARSPSYFPRLDWDGVAFEDMNVIPYAYMCGFFEHLDGYGHVSTLPALREISDVRIPSQFETLDIEVSAEIIKFFRGRWRRLADIALRDACRGLKIDFDLFDRLLGYHIANISDELSSFAITAERKTDLINYVLNDIDDYKLEQIRDIIADRTIFQESLREQILKKIPMPIWKIYRLLRRPIRKIRHALY